MTIPIDASAYLSQLKALIPDEDVKDEKKDDLKAKINRVLEEVSQSRMDKTQSKNLRGICQLAKKADKMQLLSDPAKALVKQIATSDAVRDLTLQGKDGSILVNPDLLTEKNSLFEAMFKFQMTETTENKVKLENYSTKTLNLLMTYLNADDPTTVPLPPDNTVVRELIELSLTYGFDELFRQIEPAVTAFIEQHSEEVVVNARDWLNLLHPHTMEREVASPAAAAASLAPITLEESTARQAAVKWTETITVSLLTNLDISFTRRPGGKFEIPVDFFNFFYEEDTRDLPQLMPVTLAINGAYDIEIFREACEEAKLKEPLTLKLSCFNMPETEDKDSFYKYAELFNFKVKFENYLLALPSGTKVFGQEQWETYWGSVGEVPHIPANIREILQQPCPWNKTKTKKDTHLLVLLPATVRDKPLTLNTFLKLAENPNGGRRAICFDPHKALELYGNEVSEKGACWVLLYPDAIPDSRDASYSEQLKLIAKKPGYEEPDIFTTLVCALTHYVHTGERIFSMESEIYTRCREFIKDYPAIIGCFIPPSYSREGVGIELAYTNSDDSEIGMAAMQVLR